MHFEDLSYEQATTYRDHIIARERPRLSDLAYWLRDDGGPVDLMDGSSSSLVDLWRWYRDFQLRDFPGVELAGLPSGYAVVAPHSPVTNEMRGMYVREAIEHYFAQVIFHTDAGASWRMYDWTSRGAIHAEFHQTGIATSMGHFISPSNEISHLRRLIERGQEQDPPDEALRRKLEGYDGWPHPGLEGRPFENFLIPLLREPRIPADDPARALPVFSPEAKTPIAVRSDRAGGSVMLISGHQLDEDLPLERYPALPAIGVAGALASAGFAKEGNEPIDPADLVVDGATFQQRSGWAVAWTTVHDGVLRAITIRALDATEEEWKGLLLPLKEFAASIDATVE